MRQHAPDTSGAYILGCAGPRLTPRERDFFREAQPWGFILFARNLVSVAQTRALCDSLRAAVGWNAPVLVDQEGGRVERMGPPHWRSWLPPLEQMEKSGARAMQLRYRLIAHELRTSGIDVNCVPCCDIANETTHPVLKNRCYGQDAGSVTRTARAVAEGCLAGGVLPVVKHMPGHGRAHVDTHKELQKVDGSIETLMATDFAPYAAMKDAGLGMSVHLVFPAIDPDRPATQSPDVIKMIRRDIGFQGLLMTDDISMEALSGTVAERGLASLNAGCDLVLHCNGNMDEMETIAALGPMDASAKARAARALAMRIDPDPVDIFALEEEFLTLVPGGFHV